MPYEKGGRADKKGNKYEINCIVYELLKVLDGSNYSVVIEALGEDEKGTDILVTNHEGKKEHQQCKARNGSSDNWTISDLKARKIFNAWKIQLDRECDRKVALVSPMTCSFLVDLNDKGKNVYRYEEELVDGKNDFMVKNETMILICMLVPVFCIREKDYVDTVPAKESAFRSLVATFKNGEFRKFVGSDIFYWIALTMFQTGLPFFVTSLLKLPETMTTLYFVGMTALSLVFYVPVNKLTLKLGKKKMILFAFAVFSLAYFYTGFMGKMIFIPATVQGLILTVVAALPMAIFGILPQAVVADIAQSDSIRTGSNREGMFYAARTFAFKLGQSLSMLIFTAVSTIGAGDGTGYRVAAFGAAVFCCIGGIILVFYNEKKINGIIGGQR